MGLPEHISGPIAQPTPPSNLKVIPAAALLITPTSPDLDETRSSFGYQFLFGIFPLTRLFLEHGPSSLLQEVWLELLQLRGFRTYSSSKEDAALAAAALQPALLVEPSLSDLSVNAYDALVLRIIRVSGLLNVRFLDARAPLEARRALTIAIDETAYRTEGHAPTLAYMLKNAVSAAASRSLDQYGARPRAEAAVAPGGQKLVLVPPPRFAKSPSREILRSIGESYGFRSYPDYGVAEAQRIVQRGLLDGLRLAGVAAVGASEPYPVAHHPRGLWELTTTIESLQVAEEQSMLSLRVTLHELQSRGTSKLLVARCEATAVADTARDGRYVIAIEEAAASAAQKVMSFSGGGQQCVPL